jgi:hypothetical protein
MKLSASGIKQSQNKINTKTDSTILIDGRSLFSEEWERNSPGYRKAPTYFSVAWGGDSNNY